MSTTRMPPVCEKAWAWHTSRLLLLPNPAEFHSLNRSLWHLQCHESRGRTHLNATKSVRIQGSRNLLTGTHPTNMKQYTINTSPCCQNKFCRHKAHVFKHSITHLLHLGEILELHKAGRSWKLARKFRKDLFLDDPFSIEATPRVA